MLRNFPPLASRLLEPGCGFASPRQHLPEHVTLDNPALDVMTDLRHAIAVVIQPGDSVDEAHRRMIQRGVRLLLVIDRERRVAGIVTATDTMGEKPMQVQTERRCAHAEVLVSEIMTPQERLEVLDMADVRGAKVGHVVATLKLAGRQHATVVEYDAQGRQTVCGLFSTSQIAHQLGVPLQATEVARTFSEIEAALAH